MGTGDPGPKAQALFDPLSWTVISFIALHQSCVERIGFVPVFYSWLNKEQVEIFFTPDTDTEQFLSDHHVAPLPNKSFAAQELW